MDRTYLNPSHLLYIPQNYLNAKCSPFICISSICLTWAAGFFFLKVQSVISMSPPPPRRSLESHSAQRKCSFQTVRRGKDDKVLMKSGHHFFMAQEAIGSSAGEGTRR